MTGHAHILHAAAVVAAVCAPLALAATSRAAVEFAAEDDLNLTASYRPGTLESMQANGVSRVRFIVFQDRDSTQTYRSIQLARDLGLATQVVLAAGPAIDSSPAADFPRWAAGQARDLAALGVTRFSVLDEPDLFLPADDACDTLAEVRHTLISSRAVLRPMSGTKRVRVWRRKAVRRHGHVIRRHGRVVTRRVPATRRVLVHRHPRRYRRVQRYRLVRVTRSVKKVLFDSTQHITYTAQVGCTRVKRARIAARIWRETVPLVRAAAPAAEVLIGETSPVTGVRTFVAEARHSGLPAADGWAEHPYHGAEGGIDQPPLQTGLPAFYTEYGTRVRTALRAEGIDVARRRWQEALVTASLRGVRQVVAYGWWKTGLEWDTAAEDVVFSP